MVSCPGLKCRTVGACRKSKDSWAWGIYTLAKPRCICVTGGLSAGQGGGSRALGLPKCATFLYV